MPAHDSVASLQHAVLPHRPTVPPHCLPRHGSSCDFHAGVMQFELACDCRPTTAWRAAPARAARPTCATLLLMARLRVASKRAASRRTSASPTWVELACECSDRVDLPNRLTSKSAGPLVPSAAAKASNAARSSSMAAPSLAAVCSSAFEICSDPCHFLQLLAAMR